MAPSSNTYNALRSKGTEKMEDYSLHSQLEKNTKGYTIQLDKFIGGNGKGLQN